MDLKKRSLELNKSKNNELFTLQFSSDAPIPMNGRIEILDHSNLENINLERLQGGSLLVDHDRTLEKMIGTIEAAWIEDGRGFCSVRFGSSPLAEQVKRDIEAGIISAVSVGYSVDEYEERGDSIHVTKWAAIEVSIVACPADISCKVQRSKEDIEEEKRVLDIKAAANNSPIELGELVIRSINDGLTVEEFRNEALKNISAIAPKNKPTIDKKINMNKPEFNLNNVIRSLAGDKSIDIGFELEQSRELELKGQRSTGQGIIIPTSALVNNRAFNISGAGNNLVAEEQRPDLFIEALRPHSIAVQAGVSMLTGLVGNVAIPKQTGTAQAHWLDLDGVDTIAESVPQTGAVNLSMKSLAALVPITHALLKQSVPSAETLVKNDLLKVMANALDSALVSGTGANNQPRGVLNTAGINKVSAGDDVSKVPTFKELVSMFGATAAMNADVESMAYLCSPDVATALMGTFIDAGTGAPIWSNNQVAGRKAFYSSTAPLKTTIFGNWADVLIGTWGSIEIAVDPAYAFNKGTIAVRIIHDCDIVVRNPEAFTALV